MRSLVLSVILLAGATVADDPGPPSELADLLGNDADPAFSRALTPRAFVFPADHGPHPGYRNEWWYLTGNLDSDAGRRFGYELTFFRFALAPAIPASGSAWRTNQVYIAHLAVTDADDERFFVAQRYSRGALGLAGAEAEPFRVWIDDWRIAARLPEDSWHLHADDVAFGLDVTLTGGTIRIGRQEFRVSGLSWLDREWSTSALAADQVGWDWFALQLEDGSELMFYQLRKTDGSADAASAGTFVDADGVASHLDTDAVEITVLDAWVSPKGGTYPARWRIRAPRLGLSLTVTPVMANQELFTTVRYWEGAVDVDGSRDGETLAGRGYVELTGYAQ